MDQRWLLVSEVARITGIPHRSITNYINNHGLYLRVRKNGRAFEIHESSIEVLRLIRELYDRKMTFQSVEEYLSQNHQQFIEVSDDDHKLMPLGQWTTELKSYIQESFHTINEQQQVTNRKIQALLDIIERQMETSRFQEERIRYLQNQVELLMKEVERKNKQDEQNYEEISTVLSRVEKYSKQRRGLFSSLFIKKDDD